MENFRESPSFQILFICSGNIIRSPYAHLLFEHLIQGEPELEKIRIESGGVTYRNDSISWESRDLLLKEGVSIERIAKFIPRYALDYPEMFQQADLVLVMEKNHYQKIPQKIREKSFLLLEFTMGISENIPDPYFDPPYERSFQMINEALVKLKEFFKEYSK